MTLASASTQAAAISLASVVQPCFGPNGLCVLLETTDGHGSCTSSGVQLSQSILPSHPASGYGATGPRSFWSVRKGGVLITRAVQKHHSISGDGSKKMLLILAEAMKEIQNSQKGHPMFHVEVSQALYQLQSVLLSNDIIPSLRHKDVTHSTSLKNFQDFKSLSNKLLDTCIGNQYNCCIKNKLKELVSMILFPNHTENLADMQQHLELCADNLDTMTVHLPGTAVTDSQVLPGFLIDRDFVDPPEYFQELRSFRLLVVLSGLGQVEADSIPTTLSLKSSVHQALDFFPQFLERLIQHMRRDEIQLVLCGGRVTPVAAQLLRTNNILAIQMVPEDTLVSIAKSDGSHPLHDITSLTSLSSGTYSQWGTCCKYVTAGQRRFIQLQCGSVDYASVLLCGPTTGFCRQLAQTIRNSLQVLRAWCHKDEVDGEECLLAVAGGGAWEVALVRQLEEYISAKGVVRGSTLEVAVRALQKGLLTVPHMLYTSSLPQSHPTKEFHCRVFSLGTSSLGVDCIHGCLKTVEDDWPAWEPFWSQHLLLHSVVALLSQLLRIDRTVSITRAIPSASQEETDTDSDCDSSS